MNITLTFTHTRTNTFTNAITNTYTHTNLPLRKSFMNKGMQEYAVRKSIRNISIKDSVDFNHIVYPPTLPGGLFPPGRNPLQRGWAVAYNPFGSRNAFYED